MTRAAGNKRRRTRRKPDQLDDPELEKALQLAIQKNKKSS
jgi:hypothetical protein